MRGKKVLDFLLFRSAINSRNVSSLLLVGLFFLGYVAMGGKITTIPRVETTGFGGVKSEARKSNTDIRDFSLSGDVETPSAKAQRSRTDLPNRGERAGTSVGTERGVEQASPAATDRRPAETNRDAAGNRLSELEARLNRLGKNADDGTKSNVKERR